MVDWIDADHLAEHLRVIPAGPDTGRVNGFVRCGGPLPGHEVAIRDDQGHPLPDLQSAAYEVRGPSVMSGYFAQPGADPARRSRRTVGSTPAISATWSTAASS